MIRKIGLCIGLLSMLITWERVGAEPFTYQGQLKDAGVPVSGPVNLGFKLFDAAAVGNQVGNTLTFNNQVLDDGLFTVALDFGFSNVLWFPGAPRWLEITVNGTPLTTRQPLNPAPYAIRALRPWQTSAVSGNDVFFTTNGVLGSGNVGIGDSTPLATLTVGEGDKFQVNGTNGRVKFADGTGGITFPDTTSNSTPMIQLFDLGLTLPTSRMILGHSVNFPQEGLQYSSHSYSFRSASNIALSIDVDLPFVGINRSSRVTGSEYFGIQAPATGTSYGGMYIRTDSTTAKPFYGYTSGSGAGSQTGWTYLDGTTGDWRVNLGADRLVVTDSGNVGIDTNTPSGRLHIEGGTDAELASGGFLILGATASTNIAMDNNEIMARNNGATSPLYLNNEGGNIHLIATGTGGVSIATATIPAGVKLAVNGKVLCEELEVQLSGDWPDYVFEENYPLMPLDQLEQSIQKNKHLPGVRSAQEIARTGVNVGQVQAQTLQKVEELTLYMIEMNKQLESVKRENEQLRARLAAVEGGR